MNLGQRYSATLFSPDKSPLRRIATFFLFSLIQIGIMITCWFFEGAINKWILISIMSVGIFIYISLSSRYFYNVGMFIVDGINSRKAISNDKRVKISPSKFALFFAGILQDSKTRDSVLDDLDKRFKKDVKKHGHTWAKYMLWRDNFVSLWSGIIVKIIKGLKWLGVGYLIEKFFFR